MWSQWARGPAAPSVPDPGPRKGGGTDRRINSSRPPADHRITLRRGRSPERLRAPPARVDLDRQGASGCQCCPPAGLTRTSLAPAPSS
eukprot:3070330-Rhodomonas_salina.2